MGRCVGLMYKNSAVCQKSSDCNCAWVLFADKGGCLFFFVDGNNFQSNSPNLSLNKRLLTPGKCNVVGQIGGSRLGVHLGTFC